MKEQYFPRRFSVELIIVLVGLLFLSPFYFVFANSLKPLGAIIENAAALPESFHLENYRNAWRIASFPRLLLNSVLVTSFSIAGMVIMGAMAAWRMVRRPHRVSGIIFVLLVSAMVIPFQSVMIPMVKISSALQLINSIPGIVIIYFSFGMPLTVFLFHGFAKNVPRELEESAYIDGCSTFQSFFRIVLPMLKTMVVTVIILQTLWIWNDFLLPLLVLFDEELQTIPLGIFRFFGRYQSQWDVALATLTMGMLPIVAFFLFLQKHIIRGVTAGSVKA
ncbi:MAG: carbohydrate ABC transporter permease [Spirochaetota bacterium]